MSKKEYEKFASKFKEFKYDLPLKQLTIGNIEKYVSIRKHSIKRADLNKKLTLFFVG